MFLYSCPNEKFWKEIHGNQIKFQSRVNGYPISDPIVVWCIDNFDPTDYTCKRVLHNNCAGFHWTRASNVDSSCCKLAVSGNSFAWKKIHKTLMYLQKKDIYIYIHTHTYYLFARYANVRVFLLINNFKFQNLEEKKNENEIQRRGYHLIFLLVNVFFNSNL